MNQYSEVLVPPNIPTIINAITVPNSLQAKFAGVIIWCNYNCDIQVRRNTRIIGGGKVSWANQTLCLDYSASPYGLMPNDTILIFATQEGSIPLSVCSTLLIEQL